MTPSLELRAPRLAVLLMLGLLPSVRVEAQTDFVVSDAVLISEGATFGPRAVACGPNGEVFVRLNSPTMTTIRRSFDFGRSFEAPRLIPMGEFGEGGATILHVDNEGRIYCPSVLRGADSIEDVLVNSSLDWGSTWLEEPVQVSVPDGGRRASLLHTATADLGRFHALYTDFDFQLLSPRLLYSGTRDSGQTFDEPFVLGSELTEFGFDYFATGIVAIDGSVLCAAYLRTIDYELNTYERCARTSFDEGLTWSEEIRIDPLVERSGDRAIASGPNGLVYAAYGSPRNGILEDLFFARSTDYGLTFEPAVRLDTASAPASSRSSQVSIASDVRGHVVVAWLEGSDLHVNVSHDGGASWLGDQSLGVAAGGGTDAHVLMNSSGHVAAFHYRFYPDGKGCAVNVSRDFGDTWLADSLRIDLPGNSIDLHGTLDAAGRLYAIWTEEFDDGTTFRKERYFRAIYPRLATSLAARADGDGVLVIPPEGAQMTYDIMLRNHHPTEPISGLTVWLEAKFPDGSTVGPLKGPFTVSFAPDSRKRRALRQRFPAGQSAGLWELVVRTAGPIEDAVGIPIVKQ